MSNHRSPALLLQARDSNCLLRIPDVCNNDTSTTVAAHSNWLEHGKGRSIKAHDYMIVQACYKCHIWLDQGDASKVDKRSAFDKAHKLQLAVWSLKANQVPTHPHKKAAAMALEAYYAANP